MAILAHLAQHGPSGFAVLAKHLGVANTVAWRLLKALLADGWVERNPAGYRLGLAAARLVPFSRRPLAETAQPILNALRDTTGHTCILIVEEHGPHLPYLRCAAKATHENAVGMQEVGAIRTAYLGHPWAWLFSSTTLPSPVAS